MLRRARPLLALPLPRLLPAVQMGRGKAAVLPARSESPAAGSPPVSGLCFCGARVFAWSLPEWPG